MNVSRFTDTTNRYRFVSKIITVSKIVKLWLRWIKWHYKGIWLQLCSAIPGQPGALWRWWQRQVTSQWITKMLFKGIILRMKNCIVLLWNERKCMIYLLYILISCPPYTVVIQALYLTGRLQKSSGAWSYLFISNVYTCFCTNSSVTPCPLGSLSYLLNQPAPAPALTLTPSRFAELLTSCFRWLSAAVEGLSNAFQSYFENAKKKEKHRCCTYNILTFCVGCCANFVRL